MAVPSSTPGVQYGDQGWYGGWSGARVGRGGGVPGWWGVGYWVPLGGVGTSTKAKP